MRAEASTKPPGGLGTISVIALLGYDCAIDKPAVMASSKVAAKCGKEFFKVMLSPVIF